MGSKGIVTQEEVIYYELVKMEERITEKAEQVLKAHADIKEFMTKFEILANELLKKMEEINEKL
jgi:hypothetical protein